MSEDIQYRKVERMDLPGIADVFIAAFPESVAHYTGGRMKPLVVEDFFRICLDTEPESFFAAFSDGRAAGYIFAPMHLSRISSSAFRRGHLLRMFFHWVTGRYGFFMKPVIIAARNWLGMLRDDGPHVDARILSIAVRPDFQGKGIGGKLLGMGLDHLKDKGQVRLEVRPDNASAVHIYEKAGFEVKGKTRDTQGDWLIMVKDMGRNS